MPANLLILMRLCRDLVGLVLIAASLPLALELLVLSIMAALPSRRVRHASGCLRLAVVIPAHNEEKLIGQCVASIVEQNVEDVTVYVVAHNCSDGTADRAREAGAQALILNDRSGGKGLALDFGFCHALEHRAQALLVVDADSTAGPGMIARISAALAAGAQAVQCRYQVANPAANPRTRLLALAFTGINVLRPLGRSRLGLSCGIFGNGFGMRAETLATVPYTANSLVEDLEYHLHLLRAGLRVDFLNDATVYGEMPETGAASATQRARWEGGRKLMRRLWTWPLLLEVLRGRWRLIEPLLDLLAVPLATEALLLALALAFGLTTRAWWVTACAVVGIFAAILYVIVAAMLGPEPSRALAALLKAPGYLFWKVLMIPRTRAAARRDAAWVRTKRNEE